MPDGPEGSPDPPDPPVTPPLADRLHDAEHHFQDERLCYDAADKAMTAAWQLAEAESSDQHTQARNQAIAAFTAAKQAVDARERSIEELTAELTAQEAAQPQIGEVSRTPHSNTPRGSVERPTHRRIESLAEHVRKH